MYRITTLSQHHKNKHVLSANTSTKAWIRFNEVRKIRYAMLPVSFELANMFMFEKLFLQKLQILIASMKWFVIDVNDPENFIACNRLEMNHFLMNFIVIYSRHNSSTKNLIWINYEIFYIWVRTNHLISWDYYIPC